MNTDALLFHKHQNNLRLHHLKTNKWIDPAGAPPSYLCSKPQGEGKGNCFPVIFKETSRKFPYNTTTYVIGENKWSHLAAREALCLANNQSSFTKGG